MLMIFLILLHIAGLICLLPFSKRLSAWFIASTGFVWGLLLWIFSSLLVLFLGLEYSWINLLIIFMPVLFVALYFTIKNSTFPRELNAWIPLFISILVITALATLVSKTYYVYASTDSFTLIYLGKVLARSGLVPWGANIFTAFGAFSSIIQMSSQLLPGDFISGYQTILGISLFSALFMGMFEELSEHFNKYISALIAGVLILTLASTMMQNHLLYLHNNLPAAVLLFLTLYSFWKLMKSDQEAWIWTGILALIGFSLTRIEGPIYSSILLLIVISQRQMTYKRRLILVLPYTIFNLFWHVFLYLSVNQSELLSSRSLLLIIAILLGVLLVTLISEKISSLLVIIPEVITSGLFFGLLLAILVEPDHMITSITHIWQNLINIFIWGWSWFIILATLPFLIMNKQETPGNKMVILISFSYFMIVLLLVLARVPYRLGQTDSANRLLLQILPILVFIIASNAGNLKKWFSPDTSA